MMHRDNHSHEDIARELEKCELTHARDALGECLESQKMRNTLAVFTIVMHATLNEHPTSLLEVDTDNATFTALFNQVNRVRLCCIAKSGHFGIDRLSMDRLWNTLCFLLSSDRVRELCLHLKGDRAESLTACLSGGGKRGRGCSSQNFLQDDGKRNELLENTDQDARDSYRRFLKDESDCDRLSQKIDPQVLGRLQFYLDNPTDLLWYVEARFYED